MEITVSYGKERKASGALIVDYFENSPVDFGDRFAPGDPYFEIAKPVFDSGDFSGKWKQNTVLYTYGKMPENRIVLVGLGTRSEVSPFQIKVSFGHALKKLQKLNVTEVSVFIDKKCTPDELQELAEFLVEAAHLSQYRHPSYKKNAVKERLIDKVHLIISEEMDIDIIEAGIREGTSVGSTVNQVRDLINKPANYMTPTHMANYARRLARENELLECDIFDRDQIAGMGMGGILSVSKGSKEPPFLIKCTYTPEEENENIHTIALVGKGVTFDSGGISLKGRSGMYRMKDDMAGAAVVLGIMRIAAQLRLPLKVIGIVPTCENLPGGDALKPSDIITAFDGTSVEVYDTDAEGRLILMDGLGYAVTHKPDAIIDVATLTGACTIALGRYVIGGFTNHQPIMDILKTSGDYLYERVWQLPLMSEYKLQLKSTFADIRNHGGREGGAITAAVFLSHFVQKIPWIHLDIAGVTWFDSETSLIPEGASGIGVRLVTDFLRRLGASDPELWKKETLALEEPDFKEDEVDVAYDVRRPHRKYFFS